MLHHSPTVSSRVSTGTEGPKAEVHVSFQHSLRCWQRVLKTKDLVGCFFCLPIKWAFFLRSEQMTLAPMFFFVLSSHLLSSLNGKPCVCTRETPRGLTRGRRLARTQHSGSSLFNSLLWLQIFATIFLWPIQVQGRTTQFTGRLEEKWIPHFSSVIAACFAILD